MNNLVQSQCVHNPSVHDHSVHDKYMDKPRGLNSSCSDVQPVAALHCYPDCNAFLSCMLVPGTGCLMSKTVI